ncbi:hypothetical protein SAMN02745244_01218 [Tessaracoccus bendigoensis DSM 12906]|uniref:Uncharacterized protein n=1 Tax=Tessaracoccus bendigoensis DSM 12906 TaxID=1123357 RepID=A0A1M6EKX4_9ACTN|nr:hypothetical protein [Tessaracoccus bendigoensis]SHI85938.1 hypothetical protein SAMN02745244_01218 [Tessaracoccus bendigoensis DSM 12906]
MTCKTCGRPTDGSALCVDCLRRQQSVGDDPYAVLSTPPAQGRSVDPYLMTESWSPQSAPPPPPVRRTNWTAAAVIGGVALVLAGLGVWYIVGTGSGDSAAVPVTTPPPSETAMETPQPVETSTVFVTVEPTSGATSAVARPPSAEGLNEETAVAALNRYLSVVAGDPDAGWEYLTPRRQAVEDWASFSEFWASVSSASVTGCRFDSVLGTLNCDLTTVDPAGKVATSESRFWLTEDNGTVRIDVAGGGGADQVQAEDRLEAYRRQWLPLTYDERWVAELSAKRPGISDPLQVAANGTHVFYFTDILAMHEDLAARFPDVPVMMLRREDWGKQGRDLWHSVADPGGLYSREDAEAWCAAMFPELSGDVLLNQCTPRKVTAPHS